MRDIYKDYKDHRLYRYVYTAEDCIEQVRLLDRLPSELALDAETYCLPEHTAIADGKGALCPHMGRISILILKSRQMKPIIFDLLLLEKQKDYDRRVLYDLLIKRILIAHNASFDLKFLKRHFGVIFPNVICTLYLTQLLGNATGSKFARMSGRSLKDILRDLLNVDVEGKGTLQTTSWYSRPDISDEGALNYWFEEKLPYAAGDVRYLHKVVDTLKPVVCNPMYKTDLNLEGEPDITKAGLGMDYIFDLDMSAVRSAAEMEYNGIPASKEIFDQLQIAIWDEVNQDGSLLRAAYECCKVFGLPTFPSLWGECEIPTEKSWKILNNPSKLKAKVNKLIGTSLDTLQGAQLHRIVSLLDQMTDKGELELVSEEEESSFRELEQLESSAVVASSKAMQTVIEYKKLKKLHSFDLGKHINPLTGCIHSRMLGLGTGTGRFSCKSPNAQQVPSRVEIECDRPKDNLFPSSCKVEALKPDWAPFGPVKDWDKYEIKY